MKKQGKRNTTQTQTQTQTVDRTTAWKEVDRIFPTDYIKDDTASERAGYPVYRSTASECNAWINDLGARLEVNLPSGETVNIWVKEDTTTQTASTRPTFDQAKRDFETAYAAGDYAAQLQTLAQAVAVSVLRKCIDPQRKTAGTLDTVSNSGVSGALLDLRRGIFHDVHALGRVAQAGAAVVLTQYSPDGYITDAILDPDEKALFDAVCGDTLSDGMDLVQTAAVALLEQAADHAGAAGWLDTPYTVRRPSRKVLIKTDTATYKDETTTPVQEVYRAVRRAIANSRAVQTDPRNGYTYLEVETADGMDTVYLRTGKYADLGGYTRDGHAADSLPGAPAGYAGGFDPYTADRQTVADYYDILARLDLTPRQREILEYRMQGNGYQAIASRLGVREDNVRLTLRRLREKCVKLGIIPAGYDTAAD